MIITLLIFWIFLLLLYLFGARFYCYLKRKPKSFAFFHPYCNAGGGGERVLWKAVAALQKNCNKQFKLVIYTGDCDVTPSKIIANAKHRFNICADLNSIKFIYLRNRSLIEPKSTLTMLFQMFGGMLLGIEAIWEYVPEVVIDTTGCPLVIPLFRYIAGCKVGAYIHYPTITNEMTNLVLSQKSSYNNSFKIANTRFLTLAKLFYYQDLTRLYKFCGSSANFIISNGSWTNNHLTTLWNNEHQFRTIVYPPCNVELLSEIHNCSEEIFKNKKRIQILSVGQIRPEKNHELQLEIFSDLQKIIKEKNFNYEIVLVIAGGCRHNDDIKRLNYLKRSALIDYGIENIQWQINISFSSLKKLFQSSFIGIHTMWNEHFGISVVEGLATGSIMIAHKSAGPKLDIIGAFSSTNAKNNELVCGFLADTKEDSCEVFKSLSTSLLGIVNTSSKGILNKPIQVKIEKLNDEIVQLNEKLTLKDNELFLLSKKFEWLQNKLNNFDLILYHFFFFFKWPILLPIFACSIFYAFRKKQALSKDVQQFFANFRVGGHRGSPIKQPENTIASMEQAKHEGADLIEFDVSLTKDGVAVILHDDTLERTTNMYGAIRNTKFEQLKYCNCAAKFNFDNSNDAIFMSLPTLVELVQWAKKNQMKMLFDIKDSDLCLLAKLEELFETYQLYNTAIVSSFFPVVAYLIKHRNPRILTGLTWRRWFWSYVDMQFKTRRHSSFFKHALAFIFDLLYIWSVKSWLPSFLGIDMILVDHNEISENYVRCQKDSGRKVCAWTVNNEHEMIWMSKTLNIPFLTDKPFLAQSIGAIHGTR